MVLREGIKKPEAKPHKGHWLPSFAGQTGPPSFEGASSSLAVGSPYGKYSGDGKAKKQDGIRKEGQTLLSSCGDFELQNTDVSPLLLSIRQRGGVTGQGAACQDGLELVDTVVRARASWCPPPPEHQ